MQELESEGVLKVTADLRTWIEILRWQSGCIYGHLRPGQLLGDLEADAHGKFKAPKKGSLTANGAQDFINIYSIK